MTRPDDAAASPEHPVYAKELDPASKATPLYFVTCDEGWRSSIVCERMYDWAADWLVETLQGKPFAPGHAS
jgi:hypothetical protein